MFDNVITVKLVRTPTLIEELIEECKLLDEALEAEEHNA